MTTEGQIMDEGREWPILEPIGGPAPAGEFEIFQQTMLKSIAQYFSGNRAPSRTTADVILQVLERDAHGQRKYGVSLDRTDLSLSEWLQHMAEELMDGAHYALAAKRVQNQFELEVLGIVDRARLSKIVLDSAPLQRAPLQMFNAGIDALVDAIRQELSK